MYKNDKQFHECIEGKEMAPSAISFPSINTPASCHFDHFIKPKVLKNGGIPFC